MPNPHTFTVEDRAKSAEVRRGSPNLTKTEMKRLIAERLRNKDTDARSFVKLLVIYTSRFGKRTEIVTEEDQPETSIDEMVRQIEAEEQDKRKGARLREPIVIGK